LCPRGGGGKDLLLSLLVVASLLLLLLLFDDCCCCCCCCCCGGGFPAKDHCPNDCGRRLGPGPYLSPGLPEIIILFLRTIEIWEKAVIFLILTNVLKSSWLIKVHHAIDGVPHVA
jgi:hypothetical protein